MVKMFSKMVWKGNKLIPEERQKSKGGYRYSDKHLSPYITKSELTKLKVLHIDEYKDLSMFVYNNVNESESGYKYLITNHSTSLTAYRTDNGFKRYLKRTGLKVKFMSEQTRGKTYKLIGSYREIAMSGSWKLLNEFGRAKGLTRTKVLDNGDYTTGYYDKKGNIYHLNPNYPRTIYNHFHE